MVCVGTPLAPGQIERFEARRWEIEDREEFTSWSDYGPSDWSLSIGARR